MKIPNRDVIALWLLLGLVLLFLTVKTQNAPDCPVAEPIPESWIGEASYYGDFYHGRKTASGTPFDMDAFTAAHRELPFGTVLHLRNPKTGKEVVVTVNDRGPYCNYPGSFTYPCNVDGSDPRELDVSKGAARELGFEKDGRAMLQITRVDDEQDF